MSEPQGWGQMKDTVLQICPGRGTSDTVEQAQCS